MVRLTRSYSRQKQAFKAFKSELKTVRSHAPLVSIITVALIIAVIGVVSRNINSDTTNAAAMNDRDANAVVECAYRSFLNRSAEPAGKQYWANWYRSSGYNAHGLARTIHVTREAQTVAYVTNFDSFVKRMFASCLKRQASSSEVRTWRNLHLTGMSRAEIFNFIVKAGDKPWLFPKPCDDFNKFYSSAKKPLCHYNSKGTTRDQVLQWVGSRNEGLLLNKAWAGNFSALKNEAAKHGFHLYGYRNPGVPSWFSTPASFRSYDEQAWLYNNGYPANRPGGKSMHEWGMAVDVACNGRSISKHQACWNWVRAHGPRYGVYNFHSVRNIWDSEAWHFSSNGR